MSEHVHLTVVTPEDVLLDEMARWVQVPLTDGLLGIWPGHAPLIAGLAAGELSYCGTDGEEDTVDIAGGILKVDIDRCVVLAGGLSAALETAKSASSTDRDALVGDLESALEDSLSPEEIESLQGR